MPPESPVDALASLLLPPSTHTPKPARPPLAARASTDPSPSPASLLQMHFPDVQSRPAPPQLPASAKHRNRSPYPRSHRRSRSSGAALLLHGGAPAMTRARSLPNPHAYPQTRSADGSASPSPSPAPRSPGRVRSPLHAAEEAAAGPGGIAAVPEDRELDTAPCPAQPPQDTLAPLPPAAALASFARSPAGSLRRRPASPLHSAPSSHPPTEHSSPSLRPERFNEAYPTAGLALHHSSSISSFSSATSMTFSMPSTPTSARSRSPSISSLGTIEDEPDREESEELEAERIEKLRLAMVEEEEEGRRRRSLDERGSSGQPQRTGSGFGFRNRSGGIGGGGLVGSSAGGNERKRWSVCGGERRGDLLDLETIWED